MTEKSLKLAEIAKLTQAVLVGDPEHCITNVSDLENAEAQDASFLANPRYEQALVATRAGVVFVTENTPRNSQKNYLIHTDPSRAFQVLIDHLLGDRLQLSHFQGVHPTSVIAKDCSIGKEVTISPHAVIEQGVEIGQGTFIGSGVYVGPYSRIGANCFIHPNVTIRERTHIGDRVIIQPGTVIGSCGFGYTTDRQGQHQKLNQLGTVTIEDDVEIGANTTIDRSRFKTTRIGKGTKIDNLVQIGHGAIIGPHNLIVAQVGISGSSQTGKHVVLAGQSALAGHIKICDGAILSARTGATKSITEPGKYGGLPATPLNEYNRTQVHVRNLDKMHRALQDIKKELELLKQKLDS